MPWKWLLVGLLALVAGCVDSGALTTSDTAPVSVTLTTYSEQRDADAADELVTYIELYDADRRPTTCSCSVLIDVASRAGSTWYQGASAEARPEDFSQATVGRGAFERDALIWVTILDDADLPCSRATSTFLVRVTVQTAAGPLQDEDTAFC